MQDLGGHGNTAWPMHLGGHLFNNAHIHIRCGKGKLVAFRVKEDIGQNGDGVALFGNRLHMADGFGKDRAFDDQIHGVRLYYSRSKP